MKLTTIMRSVIAAAALVSGYAHLSLYNDGYKDIPVGHIGAQFLLNAVGSVVIAAGLLIPLAVPALQRWVPGLAAVGGVAWAAIGLVAFWQARTSGGWFGYQDERGLNPRPEAPMAVFSEVIVLAGALGLLVLLAGPIRATRSRAAAPVS
jgi:hypothetical protein